MSSLAALAIDNVARRFNRRWVLRGVDLAVQAGEAVALMGRNGSGKTTLLRIIATSLRPTRGTGYVYGLQLVREADQIRERIGVLGHHAGVYDDLTALENLRFAMRMYGLQRTPAQLIAALESVGLAQDVNERVRGFSAGMRRRLAFARLCLRSPRLLLLDEPYAAFDADGIRLVNDYIRRLVHEGGAALIATHDPARAGQVASRSVTIVDGKIVAGHAAAVEADSVA